MEYYCHTMTGCRHLADRWTGAVGHIRLPSSATATVRSGAVANRSIWDGRRRDVFGVLVDMRLRDKSGRQFGFEVDSQATFLCHTANFHVEAWGRTGARACWTRDGLSYSTRYLDDWTPPNLRLPGPRGRAWIASLLRSAV
jgi:hypothetical protein